MNKAYNIYVGAAVKREAILTLLERLSAVKDSGITIIISRSDRQVLIDLLETGLKEMDYYLENNADQVFRQEEQPKNKK